MRCIHFTHTFSKLSETFIYDYVIHLQNHGLDLQVFTFKSINRKERPFEPVHEISLSPLNPERIWRKAGNLIFGKPIETATWPVYRKQLFQMLKKNKPDILHAHFGPMGVLLAPVAKKMDIPLVVTFYGYDISQYVKVEYWIKQYRNLAEAADAVTVLSNQMKKDALDIGFKENKVHVVHLGTNVNTIKKQNLKPPVRRFLSVGRLSEKKGHLDAIKAIQRVINKTDLPLHFDIIGTGSLEGILKEYIQKNHLQNHIHLLGRRSHQEVVEHLEKTDAFILTSKTASNGDREGTPTVLIEAQAAGLPCISTFHSGIPEIIPEANHDLLSPEGDVEAISKCITQLVTEDEETVLQRGELGRRRAEEAFNIQKETLKFRALYESLL